MSAGPSTKPSSSRKRRTEGEPAVPRKRSKVPGDQLQRIGDHICGAELQDKLCKNPAYKEAKLRNCFVCSAKKKGGNDECRFKGLRYTSYNLVDGVKHYTSTAFITTDHDARVRATLPHFEYPKNWNEDMQTRHADALKDAIAPALLPTLERELNAFATPGKEPIWRAMETECRPTCDGCMTSIFCGSWMCTLCGREVCEDCFERVRAAVASLPPGVAPIGQTTKIHVRHFPDDLTRVISCWRRESHDTGSFRRTSRFTAAHLQGTVNEMRARVAALSREDQPSATSFDQHLENESSPLRTEDVEARASAQTNVPSLSGTSSGATSLAGSPSPPGPSPLTLHSTVALPSSESKSAATSHAPDAMPITVPPSSHPPHASVSTPLSTSHDAPLPDTTVEPSTAPNPSLVTLVGDYGSENSDDEDQLAEDRETTPVPTAPSLSGVDQPTPTPPFEQAATAAVTVDAAESPFSRPPSVLSELTDDGAPSRASPAPAPAPEPIPAPIEPKTPDIPSWETPEFTDGQSDFSEERFHTLWAQGIPIVVTDLLAKFKHAWTPEYFIKHYGHQACKLVECQTEREEDGIVADLFGLFGKARLPNGRIMKLKDWPPQADFLEQFPELYADFEGAVPMPSYTRRDGVFNIASHFPKNALKPDLGPKMYNAFATYETSGSMGSTRLHMDVADAVNIMLWSQRPPEDTSTEPACAAWDIFRAKDADKLRELMREHFEGAEDSDPIHSQKYYLDEDIRRKFAAQGVYSHRILQKVGEAVFIPAGCAHQVCNLADCIKVAADFVSPENIERCAQLTEEFRRLNFSYHWKEDVLQLRTMMWFAWESCSREGLSSNKVESRDVDKEQET